MLQASVDVHRGTEAAVYTYACTATKGHLPTHTHTHTHKITDKVCVCVCGRFLWDSGEDEILQQRPHMHTDQVFLLCNFPQIPGRSCRVGFNVPLIIAVLVCYLAQMRVSHELSCWNGEDSRSVKWREKRTGEMLKMQRDRIRKKEKEKGIKKRRQHLQHKVFSFCGDFGRICMLQTKHIWIFGCGFRFLLQKCT